MSITKKQLIEKFKAFPDDMEIGFQVKGEPYIYRMGNPDISLTLVYKGAMVAFDAETPDLVEQTVKPEKIITFSIW